MDIPRLFIISAFALLCFIVFLMVLIRLINKYIVFQHYVVIQMADGKTVKTIENFDTIVSDVKDPILTNLQVSSKCPNQSLADIHEKGEVSKKPFETMCKTQQANDEMNDYYRKNIKAPTATATDKLPAVHNSQTEEDEHEIKGANYMIYNANPNPYHLDYNLYDTTEEKHTPTGVNYISDM